MKNIIKKIIKESLNSDWEWAQFEPIEPRKEGNIKVGDIYTIYGNSYIVRYVLEIVAIDEENVDYKILVSADEELEPVGSIQSEEIDYVKKLITVDKYWTLTDYNEKSWSMNESEDDSLDWIKQHSFHLDLMSQNQKKINSLSEVKKILFNPSVKTYNQEFKNVAYYLEDTEYMPVNLIFDEYLSYIEITKHPSGKFGGGKYFVGSTLTDEELLEMSKEKGSFWYEEFIGRFLPHKLNR
jgi:hypothetical protein